MSGNNMLDEFQFNNQDDLEILSQDDCYQGFFTVHKYSLKHRLFAGGWSPVITRELLIRSAVAAALPYDPIRDEVVLIKQFRMGAVSSGRPWLLEIVAGSANYEGEPGEDIIHRELFEETGLKAQKLKQIAQYWVTPGGSNEYMQLYCAQVDATKSQGTHGLVTENEDIYVQAVKTSEAFELMAKGQINNGLSIIGLQWLQLHKQQLDKEWL